MRPDNQALDEDSMLTPEELNRFLAGELGEAFELNYAGLEQIVLFERKSAGDVIAHIPCERDQEAGVFSIEAALSDPMCGVGYVLTDTEYVVDIKTRSQVRSVTKIALNHLGWIDEARLQARFLKKAAGAQN